MAWQRRGTMPPFFLEEVPGEVTAVYRCAVLLWLAFVVAFVSAFLAGSPAHAADAVRCQELTRQYQSTRAQITAIEVSLLLFSAADADCLALETKLLDAGASVDARDRLGARPLSHAARFGHLDMVDLLLARGAPLTGRSGITPIAAAAYAGSDEIVELLLAHGADERLADETGKPPIVYAAAGGRLDIVRRLLARNVDVNTRYPHELTLLMWAAGADEKVEQAQVVKTVTFLLDNGAHIDDRDGRGRTALMIAAEGGRADVVTLLLTRGADPSLRDNAGKRAADLTAVTALRERLLTH